MKKWEYLLTGTHEDLNLLGSYGWELVAVYDGTAYFKREIADEQEPIDKVEWERNFAHD